MKCLRNPITGELKRVSEPEGRRLAAYGWTYVPKGEWKRAHRPDYAGMRQAAAKAVAETFTKPVRRV